MKRLVINKMKSAIVTITHVNYGNRLQNYATFKFLSGFSLELENISIYDVRKKVILKRIRNKKYQFVKRIIPAPLLRKLWEKKKENNKDELDFQKEDIFQRFTDSYIKTRYIKLHNQRSLIRAFHSMDYEYYFAGSDQIWNPDFAGNDYYFLEQVDPHKRIAFAASIGYDCISDKTSREFGKKWAKMRYISVREKSAADIIENAIGERPDVYLDPTMLLNRNQWEEIIKIPEVKFPSKYAVCLFLGNMPNYIEDICSNVFNLQIVILNNKKYPGYFLLSPAEFLFAIKNADIILTDSFHCTVFSIIFHKQFWAFRRNQKHLGDMFTRIENLLSIMNFSDRIWDIEDCNKKDIMDGNVKNSIDEMRFREADCIMNKEQERVRTIISELLKENA